MVDEYISKRSKRGGKTHKNGKTKTSLGQTGMKSDLCERGGTARRMGKSGRCRNRVEKHLGLRYGGWEKRRGTRKKKKKKKKKQERRNNEVFG